MPDSVAIILAAGKGTRMKSKVPKALHPICGKPMTRYVIDACKDAGVQDCIVVIGHGAEHVKEGLGDDVRYVVQHDQRGTGDACRAAVKLLGGFEGDVLVLPGDTPLVDSAILGRLVEEHRATGADATVLTTLLDDAGHYGRIIRDSGAVRRIVEAKDASPEELKVREICTAIYCFKAPVLRKYLEKLSPANEQGEYYLTDVIGMMADDGHTVGAVVSQNSDIVLGVNTRLDLAYLARIIRRRTLECLMLDGVTITDPDSTYIDADVQIGADSVIQPQTYIEKGSRIGEGCTIGPSTRLANVHLGDNVTVLFSHVMDSTVGDGTRIGPFANIRPGCRIGKDVRIGDFVEAKKAEIGDSVFMAHLAYVGDASVGEGTNIGAGTITCNYDGRKKYRTVIGRKAFIGSNVTLIAPVEIGDGAYVAAGSTITDNVPSDSLAIARSSQTVKEGWAKRRREGTHAVGGRTRGDSLWLSTTICGYSRATQTLASRRTLPRSWG